MTTETVSTDLKTALRRLKLSGLLHTLPERLTLAKSQKMPYQDLLLLLLGDEIARRDGQSAAIRAQRGRLDPSMQLEAWDESAKVTFDVHIFRPLIRQPSPSATARVVIMVASEPAPGSESPKHMDWRPETKPANARSRAPMVSCSSTTLGPKAQWLSAKVPSQ